MAVRLTFNRPTASRYGPGWRRRKFSDGTDQLVCVDDLPGIMVERVVDGPEVARRQWHVVDRRRGPNDEILYPPALAGPFKTITGAVAAYKIMIGTVREC